MAGHAQLKFVMMECSKTQIRLTGSVSNTIFNDRFYVCICLLYLVNTENMFISLPLVMSVTLGTSMSVRFYLNRCSFHVKNEFSKCSRSVNTFLFPQNVKCISTSNGKKLLMSRDVVKVLPDGWLDGWMS